MTHRLQWIQNKIVDDRLHLARRCSSWRATGKRIVFTNGCFDILHRGHLTYLAQAADEGNMLVIGLNTDDSVRRQGKGPERPVNSQDDRAFALAALSFVSAVCFFDEDTPANLIEAVKPDVLVKGGDYTIDRIVGADFVQSYGGEVQTIPLVEGYSTTNLIQKLRS
jgi:rfaE bifunctional protein nucleotidyltransferase chain/domain